jgi:hypothetical protein
MTLSRKLRKQARERSAGWRLGDESALPLTRRQRLLRELGSPLAGARAHGSLIVRRSRGPFQRLLALADLLDAALATPLGRLLTAGAALTGAYYLLGA